MPARSHRRSSSSILASLAVLLALGVTAAAPAQLIEPDDLDRVTDVVVPQVRSMRMRPGPAGVEITDVKAQVAILATTARTTIEIALRNPGHSRAEAVLLLPVPAGAAVGGFAFEGPATEPTARILPADEARRTYDEIVRRTRDPALLEFVGTSLVRSSVFPVEPGGTQKIRLTYENLLGVDGDRVDYVLPRSESIVHRRPWTISVSIDADHPIATVYSPSHDITSERIADDRVHVRLAKGATDAPGSFRLSWLRQREGMTASVFAYPDPEVGGGYFLLLGGVPDPGADVARQSREVTFVIDRSGSMAGGKLDQVRSAALQIIEGLADGETFNIIDYSSSVARFAERPVARNADALRGARIYLESLRPSGGTNIHDALVEALRQPTTDGALPLVLFLTDGLPTIGQTQETAIRTMVADANPHRRRIFTFGVGADVNAPLLDRIAESTRAVPTFVLPGEDVELKVAGVFRRLHGPVLAEPTLRIVDTGGGDGSRHVSDLIPSAPPDLFEGDQLVLLGRYRDEAPFSLVLGGDYLGDPRDFRFEFDPATASTGHVFVARLWATRRIGFLVDEIRQAGAADMPPESLRTDPRWKELVDEILHLSTRFGILTEYTAFLATEGTNLDDWDELAAGCRDMLQRRAVESRSGAGGVAAGINLGRMKIQTFAASAPVILGEQLQQIETGPVQQMCDGAFFRRGERWIDGQIVGRDGTAAPETTVHLGTPEHSALVDRLAAQGRAGLISMPGEILLEDAGRVVLVINR